MTDKTRPGLDKETRTIDLDAARGARAETRGEAPKVRLLGKDYTLPDELPIDVVVGFGLVQDGNISALQSTMILLFGEDVWAEINAAGLSFPDFMDLLYGALELYGFDLGGSAVSGG